MRASRFTKNMGAWPSCTDAPTTACAPSGSPTARAPLSSYWSKGRASPGNRQLVVDHEIESVPFLCGQTTPTACCLTTRGAFGNDIRDVTGLAHGFSCYFRVARVCATGTDSLAKSGKAAERCGAVTARTALPHRRCCHRAASEADGAAPPSGSPAGYEAVLNLADISA